MQLFQFLKKTKEIQPKEQQFPYENSLPLAVEKNCDNLSKPMPDLKDMANEPDILTCAIKMAPYIKGLLGKDIGVGISNLDFYPYYSPGKVKLKVREGDPVGEGSTAYKAMRNSARTVAKIEKEVYGLPYIGTAYPLTESDGKIVGCILTVTPVEHQENLNWLAGLVENQLEAIAIAATNLSATSEELAATAENLSNNAQTVGGEIKKTDTVVNLIREIAEQINLLGLNAAIEAARAGDTGHGFNVVAGEIRKLALDTQKSAKEIMQTLTTMQQSVQELIDAINQISAGTQQQSAVAQEIKSAVEKLTSVAINLKKQADGLVNLA
ncbi:MAG: methyl-accepting chemotaxis protein [Bacillota bacterium]